MNMDEHNVKSSRGKKKKSVDIESGDVHGHLQHVSGFKRANVDIVAVHGLNPGVNAKNIFKHVTSHAKNTWIGDNNVCWLSNDDYLPSKLPKARIFIFEYNANVTFNTLQTGMNDTANLLLNALLLERQYCPHRPLIFICHSLGGLIAKRVFVKAQATHKDMANATRVFIFFGSPHRGGHGADEGDFLSSVIRKAIGEPKNSFLIVLQKESDMAQTIHEDFVNYLDPKKHHILTFFESKGPVKYVDPIVSQNSAKFGLGSLLETTVQLPTNHSNICKFSARDHLYQDVEKNVVYLVEWASAYNQVPANEFCQEQENDNYISLRLESVLRTTKFSAVSNDDYFIHAAGSPRLISSRSQDHLVLPSDKTRGNTQSVASPVPFVESRIIDQAQAIGTQPVIPAVRGNAITFAVPYGRNENYVNRQSLMDEVESFWTTQDDFQSRIALYGLGGVGKTQLAIEIAFRYRERYPEESIYWIQAGNGDRFRQSFSSIAEKAFIPGNDEEITDHFEVAKDWLSHGENGKWFMIIDNADDMGALRNGSSLDTTDNDQFDGCNYPIPQCVHGTVLITTRDRKIAHAFAGHSRAIHVPTMSQEEISVLVKSLSGSLDDFNILMRELHYLPLALAQAIAFMHHNDVHIKSYLEMIQDERHTESLLGESYPLHGRDGNVSNAVATTWKVSFDQIQRQFPSAAELLSILAFFYRQGIPKSLIQVGQDRLKLEKSLGILKAFSLITEDVEDNNIHVHRLIQITTRLWLRGSSLETQLAEQALSLLSSSFPSGKYGTWPQCELLFPHALAIIQNPLIRETRSEKLPLLLSSIGRYQDHRNDFTEGEATCRDALLLAKEVFWEDDDKISQCYEPFIEVLRHQGKFEEAEAIAREQVKSAHKKFSSKDEYVLEVILGLSLVLQDQGKYSEAVEWALKVVKEREKAAMDAKPNIADIAFRLASLYDIQGKYFEAEEQASRCISKRIEAYGPNDHSVLKGKYRLASILGHQQRYLESEMMMREVIENQKILLSSNARDTMVSRWGLARILRECGIREKLEEAEEILWRLSEYSLKVNGQYHPDFLTVESDLAKTMIVLERYEGAEKLFREVLEAREKVLRKGHPRTLKSKSWLATVLRYRKMYAEAEAIELDVLKQRSGSKISLFRTRHDKQAAECHTKALEGRKKALSWQHPDTRRSAAESIRALRQLGRFSEMKKLESDMVKHMTDVSLASSSTTSLGTWRSGSSSSEKRVEKI